MPLLLALRLVLAAVLAVAAAAKVGDRAGAARAAADLGAPRALAPAVAIALPLAELAIAASLLPTPTARPGAAAAVVLLVMFTALLALAALRGRAVACHCFGALSDAPAGRAALARNGVLLAAAVMVLVAGPGDAVTPVAALAAALGATVAVAALVTLRVLQAHGRALERADALEAALRRAGLPVPNAEAAPAAGLAPGTPAPERAALALPDDRPALLVFTDPACGPCRALAPDLARWRERGDVAVATVRARPGGPDDGDGLVDPERRVFAAYGADATPAAVLVGADGRIASRLATGPEAIRALVGQHLDGRPGHAARAARPGTPVPSGPLRSLAGDAVDPAGLGEEAVLLFWNPRCGHCRAMLPALRALTPAARVLLVSSADEEALRADALPFDVLLDPGASFARALGATGTPMAVRVGASGALSSGLAVGADQVLALAGRDSAAPITVVQVPA